MKPGCFGSVIAYEAQDEHCIACEFKQVCGDEAYKNLLGLRQVLNVQGYIKDFERDRLRENKTVETRHMPDRNTVVKSQAPSRARKPQKLSEEQQALLADEDYPIKARELIRSLFNRGLDEQVLRGALAQRENLFLHEKPVILRIVFNLLITRRGFSFSELVESFMIHPETSMQQNTARSRASTVASALLALGLIAQVRGRYIVEGDEQ